MQYQVPQFIDTEDKIAGPFTIRQFLYLCATAAVIFGLYFVFQSFAFILFALVIAAVGVGFAFLKINGQPLSKLAKLGFLFYWNPQTYLWQPDQPALQKTPAAMRQVSGDIDLGKIIAGSTLKQTLQYVQTGSKPEAQAVRAAPDESTFEVFRQVTGELRAAHRVDFTA